MQFLELATYWLIIANFVAFMLFGYDKTQAENGGWRIREDTFVLWVMLGGLGGALAGRALFRHKTRKAGFSEKLWTGAIANVLLIALGTYFYLSIPTPLTPEQRAEVDALMASAYYPGCDQVRAAGKAPLRYGEPGYRPEMDGDGDGLACEPIY
ncbi:DUF1294 domain-containing protein [Qipengyuania proteolytica]|uniref:DUF1294 domain-containing protein n=1 Tax=Qipengyuania proteolytica TaxID=2867239 RepID=UPI001FFCFB6B|nr:DUF1294 domain-containing protein [Qipengyuania proteolytica]